MSQPIKLYSTINATIIPGATVTIPVDEEINVPLNAVGKFFVRLKHGAKGITPPDAQFRPGFSGKPKKGIVLINAGANPVDIIKGDEIGELYLLALYQPPVIMEEVKTLHQEHKHNGY